ncbi:hypothetical protein TOK_0924 [Pseudonocardia sp. N23]|nr:hypothetical protein TOK_0924 [Pseudonocardia sp. N23]
MGGSVAVGIKEIGQRHAGHCHLGGVEKRADPASLGDVVTRVSAGVEGGQSRW